ncbi:MAG TPA: L,D-transpeptidase family protein [Thermodesulfobacteriota bacterium]|nr:L,D-transpeptidase family protein [Thermodesulfobacteriota bacterium]
MNVKRVLLCWSVTLAVIVLFTACTKRVEQHFTAPKTPIWNLIKAGNLRAGGDSIYARAALTDFYERRHYREAWSLQRADDLLKALRRADLEGLRPNDYHLAAIENLLAAVRSDIQKGLVVVPDRLAEFDLLLTDAFLVYGSHLLFGRVNPETIQPMWVPNQQKVDLATLLEASLASNNISDSLAKLEPDHPGFRRLRQALWYYRELASRGGWPTIPDGPTLKRSDHGSRVAALRERLSLDGDLEAAKWADSQLFDEALEQALKRFQRRHGLGASGTMDAATRAELNVSVERRVEQLELNLERWRWLPQDLGRRYILVNIPLFQLKVMEDEAQVLAMRIVVGTIQDTTPVLNSTMEYMFVNPYWNVPHDMVIHEMLPRIKRDSSYLTQRNIRMFKGLGPEAPEVDPKTVNWSAISPDDFPYRLRQDPGPSNGMGRVKLIFPNKFDVYLHDTPGRYLFEKPQRTFSHGCIRIEKPIELAVYLLKGDPRWNREAFLNELGKKVPTTVVLPERIPIYLVYWTAWADEDGTIQFRPDIYNWDAPLLVAMRAPLTNKEVVGTQNLGAHGG